jgi:hypothetical protein
MRDARIAREKGGEAAKGGGRVHSRASQEVSSGAVLKSLEQFTEQLF